MHLVIPVDEVGAGLASGAVAPFILGVVLVPLVDAFVVSLKARSADRYLLIRSSDKPTETFEAIHATSLIQCFLRTPASRQYHPQFLTRYLKQAISLREAPKGTSTTSGGHGKSQSGTCFSVVDTVTQPTDGVA